MTTTRSARRALPIALAASLACGGAAEAQPSRGELPLADVLELLIVDRDLLAIDASGGGETSERLRLGERVLWQASRGRVGVVVTDQRLLAVATGSAAWQQTDWRRSESPPEFAVLGDRVVVAASSERALGFEGAAGALVEYSLGTKEQVTAVRAGDNVAVIVTDRRALGLSPFVGGFFQVKLDLNEGIEEVKTRSNLVTLVGARRLLIFRATTGTWEERSRLAR